MKTAVVYYTFGGSTKKEAERLATELNADLCRVREVKSRSLFTAFFPGCPQAMKRKAVAIQPLSLDLNDYEKIVIGAPLWAGNPAPAFNSIVRLLPRDKEVAVFICSGSGDSGKSAPGTKDLIAARGCRVTDYRDVQNSAPMRKMAE